MNCNIDAEDVFQNIETSGFYCQWENCVAVINSVSIASHNSILYFAYVAGVVYE